MYVDHLLLLFWAEEKNGYNFLNSGLFMESSTFEKILKVTEI